MQENKRHFEFIDTLKGFAIFCVVMGHIVAWQYADVSLLLHNELRGSTLWLLIYSFHMPLFLFCSGFVLLKNREFYNIKNIFLLLKKRFFSLILPYVIVGTAYYFYNGRLFVYWYLYVLFIFYCFTLAINWILSKFSWFDSFVSSIVWLAIALSVLYFGGKFSSKFTTPLIDLNHLSMFFYFCLGFLARKHLFYEIIVRVKWLCPAAFFIFILLFYGKYSLEKPLHFPLDYAVIATAAIVFCFSVAMNVSQKHLLVNRLNFVGRLSLEIYLLHLFFEIKLPQLGVFYELLSDRTAFTLQVLISCLLSVFIMILCIAVSKVLSKNIFLKKCLFGK